ncbi:hypothetical protein Godav_026693, partial [Gossypium davidsonii]|nr:hypothetical protein [Gossypium davidsonii]
ILLIFPCISTSLPTLAFLFSWCDFLVDNSFCYPHIQHGIHISRIPEFLDGLIRGMLQGSKDSGVLFQVILGIPLWLSLSMLLQVCRQSFVNTSKWIEEVRTERGKSQIEEAEAKARDLNVIFIETSAKAGFNIKALFRKIAAALPGMETLSSTTQEDMVDVNLKFTNANASQSQQQSGGCAC